MHKTTNKAFLFASNKSNTLQPHLFASDIQNETQMKNRLSQAFPDTKTQSMAVSNNENLPKHMKDLLQTEVY